jgi:hypothetical protein
MRSNAQRRIPACLHIVLNLIMLIAIPQVEKKSQFQTKSRVIGRHNQKPEARGQKTEPGCAGKAPHPPLRGTFSQWEKGVEENSLSRGRGWPEAG